MVIIDLVGHVDLVRFARSVRPLVEKTAGIDRDQRKCAQARGCIIRITRKPGQRIGIYKSTQSGSNRESWREIIAALRICSKIAIRNIGVGQEKIIANHQASVGILAKICSANPRYSIIVYVVVGLFLIKQSGCHTQVARRW